MTSNPETVTDLTSLTSIHPHAEIADEFEANPTDEKYGYSDFMVDFVFNNHRSNAFRRKIRIVACVFIAVSVATSIAVAVSLSAKNSSSNSSSSTVASSDTSVDPDPTAHPTAQITSLPTDSSSPSLTPTFTPTVVSFDALWRKIDNGFEYHVETELSNWESHKIKASQYNASLASFHSRAEMSLVMGMVLDNSLSEAYVGGIRRGTSDDPLTDGTSMYWKWVDDTPWDFTVWERGKPDGGHKSMSTRSSVVVINNFEMRDSLSTSMLAAVYKRKVSNNVPSSVNQLPHSLGEISSCALNKYHTAHCWGSNVYGEQGDGTNSRKTYPSMIDFGSYRYVTKLASGGFHSCAVLHDTSFHCWGWNFEKQLGDGTSTDKSYPTKIDVGTGRHVIDFALGFASSCAILDDRSLKCWGNNENGQLGNGTYESISTPTAIHVDSDRYATKIALGSYHTCSALDDGSLKCWGWNEFGQLGDGSTSTNSSIPIAIDIGPGRSVKQLSLGGYHSCAILDDGTLKCWGSNSSGQIGDGTKTDRRSPTTISVGNGRYVTHIALGGFHTCAILDDKSLKCWGDNTEGQLGIGTNNSNMTLTPTTVEIGNGAKVRQVSLGGEHTCAILLDDTLKCWGNNLDFQLGERTESKTIRDALLGIDVLI